MYRRCLSPQQDSNPRTTTNHCPPSPTHHSPTHHLPREANIDRVDTDMNTDPGNKKIPPPPPPLLPTGPPHALTPMRRRVYLRRRLHMYFRYRFLTPTANSILLLFLRMPKKCALTCSPSVTSRPPDASITTHPPSPLLLPKSPKSPNLNPRSQHRQRIVLISDPDLSCSSPSSPVEDLHRAEGEETTFVQTLFSPTFAECSAVKSPFGGREMFLTDDAGKMEMEGLLVPQ